MKKVLITGAGGYIGRKTAKFLFEKGFAIYSVDLVERQKAIFETEYHSLKLPDPRLEQLIAAWRPDICIHCAGRASVGLSVKEPAADFSSGVPVTFQLLDILRRSAPECKTIFISSAAVYGNPKSLPVTEGEKTSPISPYGYHKLMSEYLCEEFYKVYKLPTLVIRIFSAYGEGFKKQVIWDICNKAVKNDAVELYGTGSETRDFINIKDICAVLHLLTLHGSFDCSVYNVASGTETTISDLAGIIISEFNLNKQIIFNGQESKGDPKNWRADISKIKQLGFEPQIKLKDGLTEFAESYKREYL